MPTDSMAIGVKFKKVRTLSLRSPVWGAAHVLGEIKPHEALDLSKVSDRVYGDRGGRIIEALAIAGFNDVDVGGRPGLFKIPTVAALTSIERKKDATRLY
jgi:hypothetical protein